MCLLIRFFHNCWGARIDTIFRTFAFGAPGLIVKEFADRTAPERAGGREQCPASRRNADEPGGCREKEKTLDASGKAPAVNDRNQQGRCQQQRRAGNRCWTDLGVFALAGRNVCRVDVWTLLRWTGKDRGDAREPRAHHLSTWEVEFEASLGYFVSATFLKRCQVQPWVKSLSSDFTCHCDCRGKNS